MEPPRAQPEELEVLRAAREELLGQLTALRARAGEQERELADRQLTILELRRVAAVELEAAEQEGRRAVAGLRLEVQEQRERCLGLLEKYRELVRLLATAALHAGAQQEGDPRSCGASSSWPRRRPGRSCLPCPPRRRGGESAR